MRSTHPATAAALLTLAMVLPTPVVTGQEPPRPPLVHSICDLSQEFSFYLDGRFHRQYLAEVGRDARNWGSLQRLDLSNTNLLVLTGGDPHVPYRADAVTHVLDWVEAGGTLLLMADGGEPTPPATALTDVLDVGLLATPLQGDLRAARPEAHETAALRDAAATLRALEQPPVFRGGSALDRAPRERAGEATRHARGWWPLLVDGDDRIALMAGPLGEGWVLLASRGLFGHKPDASDPINAAWITPLLVGLASTRPIDPDRPHRSTWAEHERAVGPLILEFHDGTAAFADALAAEYAAVRPHLVALTGVEPSPGMIKRLLVLPTGGGGFSSGERIALGAWWGGYPERRYPMVELIGHEAGHSWVLPHPEPLWNEPIATWLGVQVGRRMGLAEADEVLARQLARATSLDPDLTRLEPTADDAPRDLVWGKAFHVFEELERRHGPGAMARYFRTKRALLDADRPAYTLDDCVAVWSRALETDLFPWFRSLAFDVDAARSDLWPPR